MLYKPITRDPEHGGCSSMYFEHSAFDDFMKIRASPYRHVRPVANLFATEEQSVGISEALQTGDDLAARSGTFICSPEPNK